MKLQVNVTRAESKTVCTHLRTSSAILKYEFSPYPRYYFIVLSTKFSGGPTTAAQFFDTHFHVTSRNQGSFTNEERERALGTRLLNCFLFFIFQEWLNKVNNALFAKKSP